MSEGLGETANLDAAEGGVTIEVRSPNDTVVKMRLGGDVAPEDVYSAAREVAATLTKAKPAARKPPQTGGDLFWSWAMPPG